MRVVSYCPVCGRSVKKGTICPCGYDDSVNYEGYLILGEGIPGNNTVTEIRRRFEENTIDARVRIQMDAYWDRQPDSAEWKKLQKRLQTSEGTIAQLNSRLSKTQSQLQELVEQKKEMVEVFSKLTSRIDELERQLEESKNNSSFRMDLRSILEVGGEVAWGKWFYDNSGDKKPLHWHVLGVEEDRLLLITKDVVDVMSFSSDGMEDWRSSSLRKWLNVAFYNDVFSESEKKAICLHNAAPGAERDWEKLFLLSPTLLNHYWPEPSDRCAHPTPYAIRRGALQSVGGRYTTWWIRNAKLVENDGSDSNLKCYASNSYGVRPCIWLDLKILNQMSNQDKARMLWG